MRRSILPALCCICILPVFAFGAAPKAGRVVLIAGTMSHGPGEHEYDAGCYLLSKFLKQNGVESVVVTGGWPADESVFDGARSIVIFMDGGDSHPAIKGDRLNTLAKAMKQGVGLAALHYAVELPANRGGAEFLDWIGGYYERPYSTNPVNDAALQKASPNHPISRGWNSFELRDEWYYRIRFKEGDPRLTPILTTQLPKSDPRKETVAWAVERADGGRGFGFTGLHYHKNWSDPNFRKLLINAVLWTAKAEIPPEGGRCELEAGDLDQHLFPVKR